MAGRTVGERITDEILLFSSTSSTPIAGLRPHQFSRILLEHLSLDELRSFDAVASDYLAGVRSWPPIISSDTAAPFLESARKLLREHRDRTSPDEAGEPGASVSLSTTARSQDEIDEIVAAGIVQRLAVRVEDDVDLSGLARLPDLRALIVLGEPSSLWPTLPSLRKVRSLHLCGIETMVVRSIEEMQSLRELVLHFSEKTALPLPFRLETLELLMVDNATVSLSSGPVPPRRLRELFLWRCSASALTLDELRSRLVERLVVAG